MIKENTLQRNLIRTDGGTQSRSQLDWVAIDEYANAMREGAIFPPIVVFYDGADYWLGDGFHRVRAAEHADLEEIAVDVRQGTRRDAILYSVGANADHGVRRTNRDKRQAVMMLLGDEEWAAWPLNRIAQQCGVSVGFVHKLNEEIVSFHGEKMAKPAARKVTRNGTTYTQNTANIGKRTEPEPEPQAVLVPAQEWQAPPKYEELKEMLVRDEREVFVCHACNDIFDNEVWHCPDCDHHWPMQRDICHNCYRYREGTRLEVEPEPLPELPIVVLNRDARFIADYVADSHLIITSPPYNVGIDYNGSNDELSTYIPLITDVWRECYKVMVEGARIAVVVPFGVGRNPYIPFDCQIMQTLTEAGFTLRGRIVWDKNTTGNRTSWGSFRMASAPSIRDTTEAIIVAHKGDGTLAIPAEHKFQDGKGSYTTWLQDGDYFMELAQDHWVIAPESAQRVKHPAPFPVELVRRLIHFYGFPGCHVVDPFGGSGTVGVAAKELGCQATLFDISQEYCHLAEERISV